MFTDSFYQTWWQELIKGNEEKAVNKLYSMFRRGIKSETYDAIALSNNRLEGEILRLVKWLHSTASYPGGLALVARWIGVPTGHLAAP